MVIKAEKSTVKKELQRLHILYAKQQKENENSRKKYELLVDEVSKINAQNSNYRGLIIENESKLS